MPVASSAWNIIVVEDLYDDVQLVSKILKHHGITVHVARNGDECLTLLETVTPTLIVTDLAMPERDGWSTLRAIRQNPRTAHLPVIAVTAYHSNELPEEALRAGFNAYFPKPISLTTFVRELEKVLAS